jgi:hypothetical protein
MSTSFHIDAGFFKRFGRVRFFSRTKWQRLIQDFLSITQSARSAF